jgi:hypothetical protein
MSFILSFRNTLESSLKIILRTRKISLKKSPIILIMPLLVTIIIIYIIW